MTRILRILTLLFCGAATIGGLFASQHKRGGEWDGIYISNPRGTLVLALNQQFDKYRLDSIPIVTWKDVTISKSSRGRYGLMQLNIEFSLEGTQRLTDAMLHGKGKLLGIVVKAKLIAAPTIYEPIKTNKLEVLLHVTQSEMDAYVEWINQNRMSDK